MQDREPVDGEKKVKIRHDTFDRNTMEPLTVTVDQRGRETVHRRGMDLVDPEDLGRTQDRRLKK